MTGDEVSLPRVPEVPTLRDQVEHARQQTETQSIVDRMVSEGKIRLPPSHGEAVTADKVRAAAELAKMPGPEAPRRPSIGAVMSALNNLFAELGNTVDKADSHFLQNPPNGPLTEAETRMLIERRKCLTVFRQIRDGAQSLLDACGPGPNPF